MKIRDVTVISYYKTLLGREELTFPHRPIWVPRALKVCFFAWLAARGVILKAENLRRITYVKWCFMCRCLGEDGFSYYNVPWLSDYCQWSVVCLK